MILLFLLSKKDQRNKTLLIIQSFPSTQLFPIPICYLLKYPQKAQYYSIVYLKDAFFYIPLHPNSQPLFAFLDPNNPSQQWASQFMVPLEQHMELGSLGTTSGWPPFYPPSNTPIWALYNKCCLQIHIWTGPADQIPALSQGILTFAYAWALHPVLLGASRNYTGQALRQVRTHLPPVAHCQQLDESSPLPATAVGFLSQRGDLLGLGT
jgi:hypothetical protein